MPANALLVYNSRVGQFINGVTGLTPDGRVPAGFLSRIPTIKTNWAHWLRAHPNTAVLAPPDSGGESPRRAVLPYFSMPDFHRPDFRGPDFQMPEDSNTAGPDATVALIAGPSPVAILDSELAAGPVNFSDPAIVILRDPATGAVTAFDRHVDEDLIPIFTPRRFRKFPEATMTDSDSASAWTPDGRAIDGPLKAKKLRRLDVEDGVYWSVVRFWFKNPPLLNPIPAKPAG